MWRRLWIAWVCIIALVFAAGTASAAAGAPAEPHQGTSEFSAALNVCANSLASAEGHTGNPCLSTTATLDVPDAARGASHFTGAKSVGAAVGGARTGVKGLLKDVGLPHAGKIRFVPRPDAATQGLLKGPGGRGFVDKFGNVWVRPRGNIVGQAHWDVQLSATGKQHLGWASRSGSHINVSRDGRIVH